MLLWNKQELERVKETSDAMLSMAQAAEIQRQSLTNVAPFLKGRLDAAKAVYQNTTGAPEEAAELRLALGAAIEVMREVYDHERKSITYVSILEWRIQLAQHKLRIQEIRAMEHEQLVDTHFALLKNALTVLNGELLPLWNNVYQLAARRSRAQVNRIVRAVQAIFSFITVVFVLVLAFIFGVVP